LKEVLVTQPAKSQDSSERCKRKSLANGSPGGGEGRKRGFGNNSGNPLFFAGHYWEKMKQFQERPADRCLDQLWFVVKEFMSRRGG